jgi:hypothetical protein
MMTNFTAKAILTTKPVLEKQNSAQQGAFF